MVRMAISLFALVTATCFASIPLEINHQGVVTVNGERFDGTGMFRFAIVDSATGLNLWTNDGTNIGAIGVPAAATSLAVTDGVYSVRLGYSAESNMIPIPDSTFNGVEAILRIWFDDGVNGMEQLTPDHKLTSSPYAFRMSHVISSADGRVGIGETNPQFGKVQVGEGPIWFTPGLSDNGIRFGTMGMYIKSDTGTSAGRLQIASPNGAQVTGTGTNPVIQIEGNSQSPSLRVNSGVGHPTFPLVEFRTTVEGQERIFECVADSDGDGPGTFNAFTVEASGLISGRYGIYHSPSDRRFKKEIEPIKDALSRVLRLRGVNFKWAEESFNDDDVQIGMIAQEVEGVFPEAVHTAEDNMKTKAIEYDHLVAALVEAIKDLDDIVKSKDRLLNVQQSQLADLEARLEALERAISSK